MNKKDKSCEVGDIAELKALELCRNHGYVSFAYGNAPFDFIFNPYGTMKSYKVQVKHAKRYEENALLDKCVVRLTPSDGGKYSDKEVDLFCAVNNDTGKIWLIPFNETNGATKMTLGIGEGYGDKTKNFEFKTQIGKL